jgi:hypothetical protein
VALAAGKSGRLVNRVLAGFVGDYSISITGDIYGHTSDTEARTAIDTLGARLGGCP